MGQRRRPGDCPDAGRARSRNGIADELAWNGRRELEVADAGVRAQRVGRKPAGGDDGGLWACATKTQASSRGRLTVLVRVPLTLVEHFTQRVGRFGVFYHVLDRSNELGILILRKQLAITEPRLECALKHLFQSSILPL